MIVLVDASKHFLILAQLGCRGKMEILIVWINVLIVSDTGLLRLSWKRSIKMVVTDLLNWHVSVIIILLIQ